MEDWKLKARTVVKLYRCVHVIFHLYVQTLIEMIGYIPSASVFVVCEVVLKSAGETSECIFYVHCTLVTVQVM